MISICQRQGFCIFAALSTTPGLIKNDATSYSSKWIQISINWNNIFTTTTITRPKTYEFLCWHPITLPIELRMNLCMMQENYNFSQTVYHRTIKYLTVWSSHGKSTLISTHLIGIPPMPLRGKVVRSRQTLQVFGQLDGLPICKKNTIHYWETTG